jgi:hypothetical protein
VADVLPKLSEILGGAEKFRISWYVKAAAAVLENLSKVLVGSGRACSWAGGGELHAESLFCLDTKCVSYHTGNSFSPFSNLAVVTFYFILDCT